MITGSGKDKERAACVGRVAVNDSDRQDLVVRDLHLKGYSPNVKKFVEQLIKEIERGKKPSRARAARIAKLKKMYAADKLKFDSEDEKREVAQSIIRDLL